MDSIITIIIFVIGALIGGLTVHLFKRKSADIEENESLNDVKDLVKDLSDKIALKEGKDEERYEMVNRVTSAFTGGTKKQGTAGEISMTNILQESGLREGRDFDVQKKFDDEVNGELKRKYPDIILHLPDSRDIIIDSKVSLSAWPVSYTHLTLPTKRIV